MSYRKNMKLIRSQSMKQGKITDMYKSVKKDEKVPASVKLRSKAK